MKYLLIGIQGAGKSTQGNLLSKSLHIPYLSTGHIFRNLSHEKTQLGRHIKELINAGWLIPDKEALEIVTEYLHRAAYTKGYILDGFTRTLHQAKVFENGVDKAFYLKVSDREALWRLSYRDNNDGREDDTLIALRKRIELFHKFTEPVLEFYREKETLVEINGEGSIEEIHKDIMQHVKRDNPAAGHEPITLVSSNAGKAEQLSRYLDYPVIHKRIDVPEIQSLDLSEIVREKAKAAYEKLGTAVLVDDASLAIKALDGLPGPLIKWFDKTITHAGICKLIQGSGDRFATATVTFGFYDGVTCKLFAGTIEGSIAKHPKGKGGFGFDTIFIPRGYTKTRAEMAEDDYMETSPRKKAAEELEEFLHEEE